MVMRRTAKRSIAKKFQYGVYKLVVEFVLATKCGKRMQTVQGNATNSHALQGKARHVLAKKHPYGVYKLNMSLF